MTKSSRVRLLAAALAAGSTVALSCIDFDARVDERCTADPSITGCSQPGGGAGGGNVDAGGGGGGTADGGEDAGVDAGELDAGVDAGNPFVVPDVPCAYTYRDSTAATSSTAIAGWDGGTLGVVNDATFVDSFASVSPDALRLCFGSDRSGAQIDLYCATRASAGANAPFGTPVRHVATSSATASDIFTSFAADAGRLLFSSNRDGGFRAYQAFLQPDASYGVAEPLSGLDGLDVYSVKLSCNDAWLFLTARPSTGGNIDVYQARALLDGGFLAPVKRDDLSSPDEDYAPALSPDGLTMIVTRQNANVTSLHRYSRGDGGVFTYVGELKPFRNATGAAYVEPQTVEFMRDHTLFFAYEETSTNVDLGFAFPR